MLELFWKLFCHAGKYTGIGKCRPYVFNIPWRFSQMHELIQFETVSYGMRCVYVCTEFSFIKWTPSNFQLLAYANLMVFKDHISKLLTKIHILSNTCKTALNHCKHSIIILISNAVLHKLALQGKQARLAGKASGHGSEGQEGTAASRTAPSFQAQVFLLPTEKREGRQRSHAELYSMEREHTRRSSALPALVPPLLKTASHFSFHWHCFRYRGMFQAFCWRNGAEWSGEFPVG